MRQEEAERVGGGWDREEGVPSVEHNLGKDPEVGGLNREWLKLCEQKGEWGWVKLEGQCQCH